MDQIRIEASEAGFSVILEHRGSTQEMDRRRSFPDAEQFACYLARQLELDVYYLGKKIQRK
ncbi:hypothetical protein [Paenibacillus sp. S150]|uniref:hypothetical protein n=1 Tax=Paenibacillus sp. S150 TaxID=2749826 RepID=UPI001C578623|nr:hypothetical protein [Paenibacillus sp. S150]MBW4081299.1 hypothetical protein [Paenibacillus sp. S150]